MSPDESGQRIFELRVRHGFFKAWEHGYIALYLTIYFERVIDSQEVAKVMQTRTMKPSASFSQW